VRLAPVLLLLAVSIAWTQKQQFWAFRAPVKQHPPVIAGISHPIDAFVADKLKSKELALSPTASPRALIRRLHFDLTGLPPAGADYRESYEAAIDRLLASPRYGERWGRHWLDIVRFGETDGGEHNHERFNAWRYRDYVIDAFNRDKPYPQFIREQIAGDLLEPTNPQMVAATGFLVAGPWDQVSAELNKDKLMAMTARMDELDDMVTTTFHTFQALTVNCARCHNHKFDPIPAKDYYKLTSVFRGVTFGTRTAAPPDEVVAYDRRVKPIKEELAKLRADLGQIEDPVRTRILLARYIEFDRARAGEARRIPVNPIFNRNQFAPTAAPRWRLAISKHQGRRAKLAEVRLGGDVVLSNWTGPSEAKDDTPVFAELQAPRGEVREITWSSDPVNGARDGALMVYRLETSKDGQTWTALCSSLDHVRSLEVDLPVASEAEFKSPASEAIRAEIVRVERELAAVPEPAKVYAAKPTTVTKAHLLDRGSVSKPLEEVFPGGLTAVSQLPAEFKLNAEATDAERRTALANWIASPDNPLTARVLVNRVWAFHFGTGLVNTPSDFGLMGDRPSHPELLDWLAVWFMDNGWSVKKLHRLILTSRTYQQASEFNAKAAAIDADNRLYWRMSPRRMDAETLRDTMLALSGNLRLDGAGGPSFLLQKKGDRGSYIYKALDNDGPEVWRRAVYRFVVRGGERIMLDSFDCPDPAVATPQRTVSNTAVQALTLFNNQFVLKQSSLFAQRVDREYAGDPVRGAYDLLLGRAPSPRERELGRQFLKANPLALYCRVLINSNEFVYVP
jgi:hypothetical protein